MCVRTQGVYLGCAFELHQSVLFPRFRLSSVKTGNVWKPREVRNSKPDFTQLQVSGE